MVDGLLHIDQIRVGDSEKTLELPSPSLSPEQILLGLENATLLEVFEEDTPHYVLTETW